MPKNIEVKQTDLDITKQLFEEIGVEYDDSENYPIINYNSEVIQALEVLHNPPSITRTDLIGYLHSRDSYANDHPIQIFVDAANTLRSNLDEDALITMINLHEHDGSYNSDHIALTMLDNPQNTQFGIYYVELCDYYVFATTS